jgi:hypothetical protein
MYRCDFTLSDQEMTFEWDEAVPYESLEVPQIFGPLVSQCSDMLCRLENILTTSEKSIA